jgi:hypothetical protein
MTVTGFRDFQTEPNESTTIDASIRVAVGSIGTQ